jgi:hypothetical protein
LATVLSVTPRRRAIAVSLRPSCSKRIASGEIAWCNEGGTAQRTARLETAPPRRFEFFASVSTIREEFEPVIPESWLQAPPCQSRSDVPGQGAAARDESNHFNSL